MPGLLNLVILHRSSQCSHRGVDSPAAVYRVDARHRDLEHVRWQIVDNGVVVAWLGRGGGATTLEDQFFPIAVVEIVRELSLQSDGRRTSRGDAAAITDNFQSTQCLLFVSVDPELDLELSIYC